MSQRAVTRFPGASTTDSRPIALRRRRRLPARAVTGMAFLRQMLRTATEAQIDALAGQIAYSAVFAIGPLLSLTLIIVNALPTPAVRKSLNRILDVAVPPGTRPFIDGLTRRLLSTGHPLVLLVSVLGLLWSVSSGTAALVSALENIRHDPPMTFTHRRLRALGLGLVGALGLTITAAAVSFGPGVADFVGRLLHTHLPALSLLSDAWIRIPLAGVSFAAVAALFFAFGTPHRPATRAMVEGAALTGVISALASAALSAYLSLAPHLGGGYGAATSFFGVLLWLYVLALAALLGATLVQVRDPGAHALRPRGHRMSPPR